MSVVRILEKLKQELEDPDARPGDRIRAKRRLKEFLTRLGDGTQQLAVGLLEKYLESKIGILGSALFIEWRPSWLR